jgi:phosphopantetheinyl transferase (holo-ACP synthase)
LEVKRLIFNFNPESTCLFRVRADLLGLMIKEKTIFTKDDFSGIDDLCFNFSKALGDSHQAITILQLGEMVEQKTGNAKYNWNELIAESYEKMMTPNLQNNKHVAIEFCNHALEYYKLAKNEEKIEKLEAIYTELSRSLEFPKIEVEIDLKEYIADCEKRVKELMKFTPEQIIGFIMTDKSLLPDYQFTKELTQKISKQFQMQANLPITLTDEQGHTAQCFTTPEEIELYRTLHQYHMILENYCMRFLNMVFIEGLKENKITYEALMEFFQKYSWFGKTIPKKRFNKEVPHNWLSLLAPSLFEYFAQMDYWKASGNYPNLVLCIDSLVLKIEGLLRDMFFFKDIATFTSKADKNGKRITYEKELNALLNEKRMSELFDPNDLLLFKFVLIEKAGYNLRHKIAHSLMLSAEYHVNYAHLLILILLKLGSYNLTITRKTDAKERINSNNSERI